MSWLDNYSTTNTFRSMYINGFIDISGGRLQTRSVTDGHLFIAGDTSLNGNLYVGGDISWNPNNLADNSIPSSAIIGGVVGATGPAGDNGVNANTDIMLLDGVSGNTNAYGLTEINYNMSSSIDMLADPYVKRFTFYASPYNWRGICLLFKPGIYNVTVNFLEKTVSRYHFQFDLDNNHTSGGEPATQYDTNTVANENIIFSRSYIVPHVANFYILEFQSSTVGDWTDNYPQIKFERIGNAEPSGTDDTLSIISGATLTDTKLIEGGIYWNSSTSNPPASGYEPSNHTSQGGTNEWAVVEQAANNSQQVLAWVHRIDTNSTSSVEVASFHSDADLSLNKRLFVGEDVTLNKRLFVGEDVSLNGNLYVGGDISWNPTSLANDSIPSSAIITEFMLLTVSNPSSQFNQFCNMSYNITGNMDMLADPYALRQQGTSSSIHYGQWTSVCMTMLFNPGVYRVTFTGRVRTSAECSFGFDLNHNNYIGFSYANPGEEAFAGGPGSDRVTISYTYVVPNKTNFYFLEQLSPGTMEWYQHEYAAPQLMFERIAHVESSGTDDTLTGYSGMPAANSTQLIAGGITW